MFDDLHVSTSMDRLMKAFEANAAGDVELANAQKIEQKEAETTLDEECTNPGSARQTAKKDIKNRASEVAKAKKEEGGTSRKIEAVTDLAKEFEEQNPELKQKTLVMLKMRFKPGDKAEEILEAVRSNFDDVTLVDDTLNFLIQAAVENEDDPALIEELRLAQELHRADFNRQIVSGRNIQAFVHEASSKGLGTPTSLRDLYRDLSGNPRETTTLFEELSTRYPYTQRKEVIQYLLHSAGAELKLKGTHIPAGLLTNLVKQVRVLQAILGVYHFFNGRMHLLQTLMQKDGMEMPPELTFEALAKHFMSVVDDRYPSGDKVLQGALKLGINQWVRAKIYVFSQERDAVREVAFGQIFRSAEHRKGVFDAIISALENLEEELDALITKEEDDEGFD